MRLPQLQVGPNVNKRKPGREAAEAALDHLKDAKADLAREKVQAELTDYNQSVAKVLIHLVSIYLRLRPWLTVAGQFGSSCGQSQVRSGRQDKAGMGTR